jgi:hypothetical protein
VKRVTITLRDDLAKALDVYRKSLDAPVTLTAIVQAAMREFLQRRGFPRVAHTGCFKKQRRRRLELDRLTGPTGPGASASFAASGLASVPFLFPLLAPFGKLRAGRGLHSAVGLRLESWRWTTSPAVSLLPGDSPHLPRPHNLVLRRSKLGQRERSAAVQFLGADAHLGAEAEFRAIGEARGGIPVDGRGIHFA